MCELQSISLTILAQKYMVCDTNMGEYKASDKYIAQLENKVVISPFSHIVYNTSNLRFTEIQQGATQIQACQQKKSVYREHF